MTKSILRLTFALFLGLSVMTAWGCSGGDDAGTGGGADTSETDGADADN